MRTIEANNFDTKPLTQLKESENRFKEKVKLFCQQFIEPLVEEMDRNARFDNMLVKQLFDHNLMNIEIPDIYGGYNGSFFDTVIAIEEIAKADPAVATFVDVQNSLVNNAMNRWANISQKAKYLPILAKEDSGSFSITEKEAGSDAYALNCKAEKVDGGYILSGEKHWATNAAEARIFILFARIIEENNNGNLTAFIVDKKEAEGFKIGNPQEKLGIRASSTCDIVLDKVFVPEDNILSGVGRGKRIALETLTDGRVGIAAQMLGLAEGAFNAALKYSQERKQFGKYIGTFQGIHFHLAHMATQIEAAKLMVYNAARFKEKQGDFMEYFKLACMAKLFTSEIAENIASQALEIFGGIGYMKGCPAEKYYRDAKIGRIYEGTTNMQLRTIAKLLLKIKLPEDN